MSTDASYINPVFGELLGIVSRNPAFPSNDAIASAYLQVINFPVDDIVHLITSDPMFVSNKDILRGAIDGMDEKAIGTFLIEKFIDFNFPELMERINTRDDEFAILKNVIIGVIKVIRETA
jgi:hypothetical protein